MSEVPDDLIYTKEHEWIRVTNDEIIIVKGGNGGFGNVRTRR